MTVALIDADIVAYRVAAVSENEPLEIAESRVNELMHRILHDVGATEYQAFLSGHENFRKLLYPEYKANRDDKPKPKWLEPVREHLLLRWKALISSECEADDEIGILATRCFDDDISFVVCSIDKDLLQLPGQHYNFVKQSIDFITPLDGKKQFYRQMLIGDRSDNVKGVTGIGEVKAGRAINSLDNELDMFDTVFNLYSDKQQFLLNSQLLWILKTTKNPSEVHNHFRTLRRQEVENLLSSSPTSENLTDPGSGRTLLEKTGFQCLG